MRRAYQDYSILRDEDGFIGFALGHDYCAEHEWGIKEMKRLFGIPESSEKCMGIDARTITICPETLLFHEKTVNKRQYAILFTAYKYAGLDKNIDDLIPRDLNGYVNDLKWHKEYSEKHPNSPKKDNMMSAWSESGFGIAVMGKEEVAYLKELYQAFKNKNVVIATINLSLNNPFSRSSLSLLIKDRLPEYAVKDTYLADKEYYDRENYEKSIGMKDIIAKYGNKNGYGKKNYFMACSPKWIDYVSETDRAEKKKKYNTKYDILYWINYSDDDNNCGYYTVEEIREWLTGNKKLTEIRKA